jgi:hypothetical protein
MVKQTKTFKLPPSLDKRLRAAAAAEGITPRALFLRIVRQRLFKGRV